MENNCNDMLLNEQSVWHNPAARYDPAVNQYCRWETPSPMLQPWVYTDWVRETLSWKKGCYLHTFLSGCPCITVKGPDAEKLLSDHFVNGFTLEKFPVGACKHVIACDENGMIYIHGICMRVAENTFDTYCLEPLVPVMMNCGKYDVEKGMPDCGKDFIFQIAGPRALEVVEHAIERDIHDLKFMRFCSAEIAGCHVRILRMGMGGTLAYEVHGNSENLLTVYDKIIQVGTTYDMQRLGLLAYGCNHTENGFPQSGTHFTCAEREDEEFKACVKAAHLEEYLSEAYYGMELPLHGSMSDMGLSAYYSSPIEVGWKKMINWDHEFTGKAALRRQMDDPNTRCICTLEWNTEDILKMIYGYFDDDPDVPEEVVFPQNYYFSAYGNLADKVFDKNGNLVGKSSGFVYTAFAKRIITLGVISPEYNVEGTDLTILWGTNGTRQFPIRAKVARYPYLSLTKNRDYDMESVPHYHKI